MIPLLLLASLVDNVRTRIVQNDPAGAEREARAYQQRSGSTPEFAAALSWVARAELGAGRLDHADALAGETRKTVGAALAGRTLDSDPWLPTALGAAIAEELGRSGVHVVTVDPGVNVDGTPGDGTAEATTAKRIVEAGGQARASNISVTDEDAVRGLFAELVDEFGALDAVFASVRDRTSYE